MYRPLEEGESISVTVNGTTHQLVYTAGSSIGDYLVQLKLGIVDYMECNIDENTLIIYNTDPSLLQISCASDIGGFSGWGGGHRFGFNGQENETEISGGENHSSAEYWMYDTRIGRRWNVDPIVKSHESSYACFANSPILIIDPTGADSSLYDVIDGKLISTGVTPQVDKTAIYMVDTSSKDYDPENPWKTAKRLTYDVGKNSGGKYSGVRLRENHPKRNAGWLVEEQVYAEDLIDMTDEFYNKVVNWMPYFEEIYNNYAKAVDKTYYYYFPDEAIDKLNNIVIDLFNTDHPFDLKSYVRNNLDQIPSYHATVIGEYSFMNGRLRTSDDYGNMSFGAWLRILHYSEDEAVSGASLAQRISNLSNLKFPSGDPERDSYMIRLGYNYISR